MRERVLRAIGAIAAGFAVAWEHLTTPVEVEAEWVVLTCCPICGYRMGDAPHVHGQDVIWPTGVEGVLLLSRRDGSGAVEIPHEQTGGAA